MQRWVVSLLVIGVLAVAVMLVGKGFDVRPRASLADAATGAPDVGAAVVVAEASGALEPVTLDPGALLRGGVGARMADGTPVPALPEKAPQKVRFGVVLVTYAGAQGASDKARSPKEAREIASKLATDAKTDFHAAVVRGDNGSIDDVGSMPRGVLEPAVEFQIFTSPVGAVSNVIETPRGYWIVKRLE